MATSSSPPKDGFRFSKRCTSFFFMNFPGESHNSVEDAKKLEFNVEQSGTECLTGSFVGRRLRDAGLPQCNVRYMGGDLVLISSTYIDLLRSNVVEGNKQLAMWLAEIKPCNCKEVSSGRLTWLRCFGIPLQSWETPFFAKLASCWGTFIHVDESSNLKRSFVIVRILIITARERSIGELVEIKVNDLLFPVKAGGEAWGIRSNNVSKVPATTDSEGSSSFEADVDKDDIAALRVPRSTNNEQVEWVRDKEISSKSKEVTHEFGAINVEGERKDVCRLQPDDEWKQGISGTHHATMRRSSKSAIGPKNGHGPAYAKLHLLDNRGSKSRSKIKEGGRSDSHKSDSLNIVLSRLKKKKVARSKDQLLYGLGLKHKIKSFREDLL
ncbi:hypothetical protein Ancab_036888 [Ancistrocladus abbreviatus]